MELTRKVLTMLLLAVVVTFAGGKAYADPASSDWGSSMGYQSPSDAANLFNEAFTVNRLKHGYYAPPITNNYGDTYATTNCTASGSCGSQNDMNNVTQTSVQGSSNITVNTTESGSPTQGNSQQSTNGNVGALQIK